MPTASNGDVSLFYRIDGDGERVGDDDRPPIVFVSEAGLGGWLWGWQHAALTGPFETVVWDLRGTGRSDSPPGPYDLETLASDLGAVLADCGARSAHLVAAGLGGAIALTAARPAHPASSRIETLTLLGTAASEDAFDLEALVAPPDDREALRRSLETALSNEFVSEQPDVLEGIVEWRADGDAREAGWRAQLAALEGFDATRWLVEITHPALVICGTEDELVSPAASRELAAGLPRGEVLTLEGAGHLCFVERSRPVNDLVVGFLESHADDGW